MTPLFHKLNFKSFPSILAVNHPESFNAELELMKPFTKVETDIDSLSEVQFALIFVKTQPEIDALTPKIAAILKGDGVLWFAYPKQSSKKIKCDFNRDKGWDILGDYGFEGVRQVSIDEDWSALRFRRVEYISKMIRKSGAMTAEGKKKSQNITE